MSDHKTGEFIDKAANRNAIDPQRLRTMGAGVVLAAFSSTDWLMKALSCTEEEARQFKANAQRDFENAMFAARRAKGVDR